MAQNNIKDAVVQLRQRCDFHAAAKMRAIGNGANR